MADKLSKTDVGFEHPAKGKDHCSGCVFFQVDAPRHCHIVAGIIMPEDWCERWSKKTPSKYDALLKEK